MQERQQGKADGPNQPPIVSEESPPIEPSLGSNSTNDEDAVSDNTGLVSIGVCFVH